MKYIVKSAKMQCDCGTECPEIDLVTGHGVYVNGLGIMIKTDNKKDENIPPFGKCAKLLDSEKNKLPCDYSPVDVWRNPSGGFLADTLKMDSELDCTIGGTITFVKSGQKE